MSGLVIALAGNPNSGKTTLFNELTGARQRVGNWPGVTVEMKSGSFSLGENRYQVVDLPGIYSLEQEYLGIDEEIARNYLASGEVDLIINIIDAGNLQRNLVLTQQLLETGLPAIVALNMLDVAKHDGVEIDCEGLTENLGVPVVPLVASRREGVDELRRLIAIGAGRVTEKVMPLDTDSTAMESVVRRYHRAGKLTDGILKVVPVSRTLSERIDAWVLGKWLGVPVFLATMYLMFTVAIGLGTVFIDFFDILFGAVFVDSTRYLLNAVSAPVWLSVFLADGLGGGIRLVATFIPVIAFLFLCLSLLEDSGYLSRAAFVVDRVMSGLGLPGSAFVPLIVGFGCNVPAVMATRSLGKERDRLLTIAMAPFMSCGARLTVYTLFAAAFFPANGQNIVFFLYLTGILMAVLTGWLFRRRIFDEDLSPSFQEMPAYHLPVLRNILLTTWFRLKSFILRAGRTIIAVVTVLSVLNAFGTDGSFGNENSRETEPESAPETVPAWLGKKLTPAFAPMGVTEDNWAATVGLLAGLFAKEAVVGTLDALYSGPAGAVPARPDVSEAMEEAMGSVISNFRELLNHLVDPPGVEIGDISDTAAMAADQGVQDDTLTTMASLFGSQLAAFCYLVFILLYSPCVAVMGTIVKEAGWRWMALVFFWTLGLAYGTATTIYQIGTFGQHPLYSTLWVAGCVAMFVLAVQGLGLVGRKSVPGRLIPVLQVGQ